MKPPVLEPGASIDSLAPPSSRILLSFCLLVFWVLKTDWGIMREWFVLIPAVTG